MRFGIRAVSAFVSSSAAHALESYARRGAGFIVTTFDASLDMLRCNASATLSASRARRYGF